MKRKVFTELRMYLIRQAFDSLQNVLRGIKQENLNGEAVKRMKELEDIVIRLEAFIISL